MTQRSAYASLNEEQIRTEVQVLTFWQQEVELAANPISLAHGLVKHGFDRLWDHHRQSKTNLDIHRDRCFANSLNHNDTVNSLNSISVALATLDIRSERYESPLIYARHSIERLHSRKARWYPQKTAQPRPERHLALSVQLLTVIHAGT